MSPQMPSPGPALSPASAPAAGPNIGPFTSGEELHSTVDMVHMELLHHYITEDGAIYPLVNHGGMKQTFMAIALREPYVMHSVLALSAHHLGILRPSQRMFYHNLAMQLQTRALSLFNSIDVGSLGDSVEKRVPVFVFSCVLGFHALCDMLSHRDDDFGSALARFVGYLRLHRGMHSVMDSYWDELGRTQLKVIYDELVPQWFQISVEGRECDDIRGRIERSSLDTEERDAAQRAIDLVQWVFDAKPNWKSRAYLLCSWGVMVRKPFVAMIEAGRAEALAVLAYFFLALHYCSEVWMIGGVGRHLLILLVDHFRDGKWSA
ncbi:hypothetical protein VTK56DRAFT_2918 [Thermocarpiscus australiensis]